MKHYQTYQSPLNKLCKDPAFAKVSGVCAGIARHYKLPRLAVRIGAIFCLFAFPIVTGVAYLIATLLLDSRHW